MIELDTVLKLINRRKGRLLSAAEFALPARQFELFRKMVLDEFGRSGLETELERVFDEQRKGRHGQADTARKGG